MASETFGSSDAPSIVECGVRSLYRAIVECWNKRDAHGFAALFAEDGNSVGFDGSMLDGRAKIESTLREIFAHHQTAAYVTKVRGVRVLGPDVAMLRAIAGMVPPGQSDLNPAVNAVQSLVAAKQDGDWRIVLLQNTPAAFHGRPEECDRLTEELREVLRTSA